MIESRESRASVRCESRTSRHTDRASEVTGMTCASGSPASMWTRDGGGGITPTRFTALWYHAVSTSPLSYSEAVAPGAVDGRREQQLDAGGASPSVWKVDLDHRLLVGAIEEAQPWCRHIAEASDDGRIEPELVPFEPNVGVVEHVEGAIVSRRKRPNRGTECPPAGRDVGRKAASP